MFVTDWAGFKNGLFSDKNLSSFMVYWEEVGEIVVVWFVII